MTKWEYCEASWAKPARIWFGIDLLQGCDYIGGLNKMGNMGWEVIDVERDATVVSFFFKRAAPE